MSLQKYRQSLKYAGENDGEMELAEVPYYFPPGKWTSSFCLFLTDLLS